MFKYFDQKPLCELDMNSGGVNNYQIYTTTLTANGALVKFYPNLRLCVYCGYTDVLLFHPVSSYVVYRPALAVTINRQCTRFQSFLMILLVSRTCGTGAQSH